MVLSLLTGLIIFNLDSTLELLFLWFLFVNAWCFSQQKMLHCLQHAFQFLFDIRVKPASLSSCMLLVSILSQPPNSQIPSNWRSIFVPFRDDLLFLGAHVVILNALVK